MRFKKETKLRKCALKAQEYSEKNVCGLPLLVRYSGGGFSKSKMSTSAAHPLSVFSSAIPR